MSRKLKCCTITYEEFIGTGWVTHISTYEYGPQCNVEIEQEMQSREDQDTLF